MMQKILLMGARGQVGQELQLTLSPLGDVMAIGREELDLGNEEKIRTLVRDLRPDILVNASAYTAVDKAESEPELAYQINAITPKVFAEETNKIGSSLLHISTDYVFDGRKNTPYLETDPTHPLSVYGQSKLAAETWIQEINPKSMILRTAWFTAPTVRVILSRR
jgi:dTDP-4-dehydrorhamnose reductase